MEEEKKKIPKFISLDVVFYGNSLNYDWGGGTNYQELKKITKWDGRQYVMVSRYALRYSILHWANKLFPDKWKLAGKEELEKTTEKGEKGVVHPKRSLVEQEKRILEFPEFDLFGFMIAEKEGKGTEKEGNEKEEKGALTRVSPVKITHAISLTPTNFDTHVMANLDMVRRAGGVGSNPVTIEEKADFYVYNVTIDVERVGKYLTSEHGDEKIKDITIDTNLAKERIVQLIETILNLKRDIKGRREDLSPWLAILGIYYDGRYETYMDKIVLNRKTHYKVRRTYKKEGDTEIVENEIEDGVMPLFRISLPSEKTQKETQSGETKNKIFIYYRKGFCDYKYEGDTSDEHKEDTSKRQEFVKVVTSKEEILKQVKLALGLEGDTTKEHSSEIVQANKKDTSEEQHTS